jgi:TonB family protein
MKQTLLPLLCLLWLSTPLLADDDTLTTEASLLIGRPLAGAATSRGVLVVPGTVIPIAFRPVAPGTAEEERVERIADVAERLESTLRLADVEIRYRVGVDLAIGVAESLPAPSSASAVRVGVKLLGFNDTSATYEVTFYDGSTVITDTPLTVERGQRAVVGGLDGDDAPYLFLVLQPARPQDVMRITPDVEPPIAIHKTQPQYPEEARKAGVTGVVVVQATIDEEGRVTDVLPLREVAPLLAEAAAEAIREWRFEPARYEGKPVAVYYNLTVNFRLANDANKEGEPEKP